MDWASLASTLSNKPLTLTLFPHDGPVLSSFFFTPSSLLKTIHILQWSGNKFTPMAFDTQLFSVRTKLVDVGFHFLWLENVLTVTLFFFLEGFRVCYLLDESRGP